ncbi:MAG TPA: peptidase C39 family protein [Hypericibacter adhaerens]|uniref:peptidase C39 family protein n=1 Tax=Hypericibacter adhaerens TaxID=2602016 RepID=UPI002C36FD43|nr:peptidase C39 family protein [Hypericibacter adhaerens]HWA45368.1 peptidase C39 family protein [Hypericibacter adhaerens]
MPKAATSKAKAARRIPHYRQTTDFTCGPSSVLMSMRALDPRAPFDRASELQLWREATSVFSGPSGGHGGCGPVALALALGRRGFTAEVHVNHRDVFLGERTRSAERKEVMRVLQEQDLAEAKRRGIPVHYGTLSQKALEARFREGLIPIVLVSTHFIHGDHVAHWVVVTGFDDENVYVNDPWVALDKGKTPKDMTDFPVPRQAFDGMTCYGKQRERACVLVGR